MADKKISQEPNAVALTGTEQLLGVQSGANVNITPKQIRDYNGSYVLAASAVAVAHTGDTVEYTYATIAVPAGAMGANGQIEVIALFSHTNNANTKTHRIKFGGTAFSALPVTTTQSMQDYVRIANRNATNSQVGHSATSLAGFSASTAAVVTSAIDTTAAQNITITGQCAVSTDTVTLESYLVRVIPRP